ncbi:hypothetical protein, partial [Pseudomonas aegrilactucae]
FLSEKTRKSAQLLAQYCARSCALVCTWQPTWPAAMYAQGYPHLSAQEVAQWVKIEESIFEYCNIDKSMEPPNHGGRFAVRLATFATICRKNQKPSNSVNRATEYTRHPTSCAMTR